MNPRTTSAWASPAASNRGRLTPPGLTAPESEKTAHRNPAVGLLRSLLLLAGVAYLLSWVAGLVVFASSTQVRSTGGQVLSAYAGHTDAVVVQFVLTEGVAGLLFGVVLWRLGWVTGGRLGRVIGVTALTAAAISIAQCGIGIVLATSVLSRQDVDAASTAYDLLTRLDGVKMLLLAMTAGATALAIGRSRAALPSLLRVVTAATAIALTLSGVGYLALVDALAMAAYASLPLLIIFVTGSAVYLSLSECPELVGVP